jgi:hypothetical protein
MRWTTDLPLSMLHVHTGLFIPPQKVENSKEMKWII